MLGSKNKTLEHQRRMTARMDFAFICRHIVHIMPRYFLLRCGLDHEMRSFYLVKEAQNKLFGTYARV